MENHHHHHHHHHHHEKHGHGHVLAIPFPLQGHITPIHQFCKRLISKHLKTTLSLTTFHFNTLKPDLSSSPVPLTTFSDGYDLTGVPGIDNFQDYLLSLQTIGSKTLSKIINDHSNSDHPFTCIVYDALMPWILDLAQDFGLKAAPFFTQTFAVNYVYYLSYLSNNHNTKLLQFPIKDLPFLESQDLPSFIFDSSGMNCSVSVELMLQQFSNLDKTDFVLVNVFHDLEVKEKELMSKLCNTPVLTVGPTLPSMYLDQSIKSDTNYDLTLIDSKEAASLCTLWLNQKPPDSVVYIAFGSLAMLTNEQMEEVSCAVRNFNFLWVVRSSEEAKLPLGFAESVNKDKGLVVKWSPQLEVLSNPAIGCFLTHCGWNSTMEAVSLGVPLVAMANFGDQHMNSKYIQDVWRVGVRVKKESEIVKREEIEKCLKEVMNEGEKSREVRRNVKKWRNLALKALSEKGSTDIDINTFVSDLQFN